MPTSSGAAALDRSLNSGAFKPLEIPSTKPLHWKPPISDVAKFESNQQKEKTFSRPQMSPSLYATPKEIPLPYSPSSSPPSPYICCHKARWPILLKSSSELDLPCHPNTLIADAEGTTSLSNGVIGSSNGLEWESYLLESVRMKANKSEDFCTTAQSVSEFTSDTGLEDDAGAENSHKLFSSGGEFYDARDELSTDSGTQSSVNHIESELRGMRLSLLMEIERRRQAEETLEKMQLHWRRLREQLAHVGLFVPLDPTSSQYSMNIADELRCQLEVARFVSDSVGSDLAKAEVEMEMESELEAKNFEITRLSDRLHYYETVNQEMSQRNQEAIEMARRDGQRRKRRQRWIWGSIAATITLGGVVLAWPYLPSSTDVAPSSPTD
ncbi:hypothetical protein EUTSA_v10004394mg [Eutrema salsugineum]|uniref:Uncharacterized protein n=1 Tax=Eutrema salsugineum TaxID=72664 RepID=V4KUS9_EUTSA|nr:hypothetical protein EUTSA_v10004394mg [Eutrema salsugineum]